MSCRLESEWGLRLAGLLRVDFEEALIKRGLPIIHYTEQTLKEDREAMKK